jgi:hypothetical protein
MKIEPSVLLKAALALSLSIIFTLYLAPTPEKFEQADRLAALLLIPALGFYIRRLPRIVDGIKPLVPLIVFIGYLALQAWVVVHGDDAGLRYVIQLVSGFVPYLLFYLIFRTLTKDQADILLIATLVIPGLVHVAYLYLDVFLAINGGEVAFLTSSKQGLLEYVKDSPRVGRRYVSMALLHLLCGGLLAAWYAKDSLLRQGAWILSGLSVLSLALLDARAAYATVLIAALLLAGAVGTRQTFRSIKNAFHWHPKWKLVLAVFLVPLIALGYSAGKSRWIAMSYSIERAAHDVFDTKTPLSVRPYVDMTFWSDPIEDVEKCYLTGQFRCRVDQSAYLRMAWLLEGAQSLVSNPLGIGFSDDYMGNLWGVEGNSDKYQRVDSFLVEHIVSFGWPAILLYGWLFWGVVSAMRLAVRAGNTRAATIMLCALVLTCAGRTLVDVFSEGLWRYMMALLGIYYGLLHASNGQPKKD